VASQAQAPGDQKLTLTGVNYTKWLWGNQRFDGSLYNFTTVPGEGFGDNGQGTEFELLSQGSRHAGSRSAAASRPASTRTSGPTSAASADGHPAVHRRWRLRGRRLRRVRSALGAVREVPRPDRPPHPGLPVGRRRDDRLERLGDVRPFTIGKVRYIDRDNSSGLLFQGGFADRKLTYDLARISLPRLWAGPNFNTGEFTSQDAAYGLQLKWVPDTRLDVGLIYLRQRHRGRRARPRPRRRPRSSTPLPQQRLWPKVGYHPHPVVDMRAAFYSSSATRTRRSGRRPTSSASPASRRCPRGTSTTRAWKANVDVNDPFGIGLSFNVEVLRHRRPLRVDDGRPPRGGRAADRGPRRRPSPSPARRTPRSASSAATQPASDTAAGRATRSRWRRSTSTTSSPTSTSRWRRPSSAGRVDDRAGVVDRRARAGGEYTLIDYNTNWQAWGDPSRRSSDTIYPNHESDAGVGSFRNAYAPFQDKETDIAVLRGEVPARHRQGRRPLRQGEDDRRDRPTDDRRALPAVQPGDCPGGGQACAGDRRFYSPATPPLISTATRR
jgi:hypothetical protein